MLTECVTYAQSMFGTTDCSDWICKTKSSNPLDMWIENKFIEFAQAVYGYMEKLEMTKVPELIYRFVDNLCNSFVKLSRDRLKGLVTESDCKESLSTLYNILSKSNVLLAPFIPHLAESFNMLVHDINPANTDYTSVHIKTIDINGIFNTKLDETVLNGFYSINELLEAVRNLRQQANKPIYYPLNSIEYLNETGKQFQSVVYLDVSTNATNDMEAEINNIRRQINGLRKNLGLKMFNKVEIVFESNDYWNQIDSETLELLTSRLIATVKFADNITGGNQIETFNGKTLNVCINSV